MILRKYIAILVLLWCIPLIGVPVFADKLDFSRTYPLPITEMQDVISKWLRDTDFKIIRVDQELSEMRISAEGPGKIWEICLSQQSPLATLVVICRTNDSEVNPNLKNQLWNDISEYVNTIENKESNVQLGIPNAVLSQIETVVCIEARVKEKIYQASGFIISNSGHVRIVSTAHDFKNLKEINVILYDGSEMSGRISKIDFHRDLSLIQVDKKLDHFIHLFSSRNLPEMDEKLYSISCPIYLEKAVFRGSFTAPKRVDDLILWQVQMKIYPGSSGSPVFDAHGNLMAIVTGRYRGNESVGFLIPFETLAEFLKEK